MRRYEDKKNAQKKAYYSDRFRIAPQIPTCEIEDEHFKEILKKLQAKFDIQKAYMQFNQMIIWINPGDNFKCLETLHNDGYTALSEMSAVDFLAQKNSFEIFYQILNMQKTKRIRIKCEISPKYHIQSVTNLYKSALWAEREMYDMFGIIVKNHPALRRILMPDDWYGHPLLKTYPLKGDEMASWYEIDKIFGSEYREKVGKEQRDPAYIDEKDTFNFSRINHEVPYGTEPSQEKTIQEYQEENGVKIVKKLKKADSKIIKKRP